ncbi:Uncharacterized protein Rs2_40898 [Raphanus sativus]|nr:Uncharacterized protein Rs2_40898 [Raphanus sativus]
MHVQWSLSDRITANDLGNGKFLFNFITEDDLNSVLRQGPFHYNFCMFVLVRWEPIVHDDYPWIIPFWTDGNLRNIGGRLGHVDTLELTEGRMLIDIDTRKPLKFSRKVEYKGDEVTIEIKYTMLFKHCSGCGMLTHEISYFPTNNARPRIQATARSDVFTRMQLPNEEVSTQRQYRNAPARDHFSYSPSMAKKELSLSRSNPQAMRYNDSSRYREYGVHTKGQRPHDMRDEARDYSSSTWEANRWNGSRQSTHADRII